MQLQLPRIVINIHLSNLSYINIYDNLKKLHLVGIIHATIIR